MRELKNTLLRMAERLFMVTVVAGLGRAVLGGEMTTTAFVAMLVALATVAGLLVAVHRLD